MGIWRNLVLSSVVAGAVLHGDTFNKATIMEAREPMIAGSKVLPAGSYVWRLLDSKSNRNIVEVIDRHTGQVEATILALPKFRLDVNSSSDFQFWETPRGVPKAVRSWFYPGDSYGQELEYPKKLIAQLMVNTPKPRQQELRLRGNSEPRPTVSENKVFGHVRPETKSEVLTASVHQPPQQGSWAIISDGNAPAPVRKRATTKSSHGLLDALTKLPLTATLAPLVGLIGFISLVLYFATKHKRKTA